MRKTERAERAGCGKPSGRKNAGKFQYSQRRPI